MTSRSERNDPRRAAPKPAHTRGRDRRESVGVAEGPEGAGWLWGRHAVEAALANPGRRGLHRLAATAGKVEEIRKRLGGAWPARDLPIETLDASGVARLLPPGAVHQGLALLAEPLAPVELADIADPARGVLVLLDQVADPQNVGAVFRSAAAFGARGVILQDRRAPPLSGALAKASAGAVERVPCVRVVNLSRALEQLADLGWRAIGLSGTAPTVLAEALDGAPVVLVLGSEGDGLRRLVSEHCDTLARIPMPGGFESLNIAAAAAIAMYEASRSQTHASEANAID